MQGPTERSLFRGTFRGMFPYFWSVRCSLIQRGKREGKKEGLFFAIFGVFFSILDIFPCFVVATFYLPTRRVLKSWQLEVPTLYYDNIYMILFEKRTCTSC